MDKVHKLSCDRLGGIEYIRDHAYRGRQRNTKLP
jgi:hypothetical protein